MHHEEAFKALDQLRMESEFSRLILGEEPDSLSTIESRAMERMQAGRWEEAIDEIGDGLSELNELRVRHLGMFLAELRAVVGIKEREGAEVQGSMDLLDEAQTALSARDLSTVARNIDRVYVEWWKEVETWRNINHSLLMAVRMAAYSDRYTSLTDEDAHHLLEVRRMISMGEFDAAEDFIHRIRASLVGRLEPFMDQVIRETKARLKSGPRSHHGDPAVEEAEARFRHAIWPFRRAPSEEIIEAAMGLEHALVDTDPW